MSKKSSAAIAFACFLLLFSFSGTARALNIEKLIGKYPEYGTFHDLLNKTGLYKEIDTRQTITILVVQNESMGAISSRPLDVVKRILSTHIILDYFDVPKIAHMSKKSTMVTTLYQSSGIADNNQGFLNITSTPDNKIGFGSAVKGSPIDVKLQKLVMSQPYNISILQVSDIIYTPGIDGTLAAPPRKPVAPAPVPPKKNNTSSGPSAGDDDDYNIDDPVSPSGSPVEAPEEGPSPSKAPKEADTPEADAEPASPPKSSAVSLMGSGLFSGFVLTLLSSLAIL